MTIGRSREDDEDPTAISLTGRVVRLLGAQVVIVVIGLIVFAAVIAVCVAVLSLWVKLWKGG